LFLFLDSGNRFPPHSFGEKDTGFFAGDGRRFLESGLEVAYREVKPY